MIEFTLMGPPQSNPASWSFTHAGAIRAELPPVLPNISPSGVIGVVGVSDLVGSILPSGVAHLGTLVSTVQNALPSGAGWSQTATDFLERYGAHLIPVVAGALAEAVHLNPTAVEIGVAISVTAAEQAHLLYRKRRSPADLPGS